MSNNKWLRKQTFNNKIINILINYDLACDKYNI